MTPSFALMAPLMFAGLIVFPFRKLSPRVQIAIGVAILALLAASRTSRIAAVLTVPLFAALTATHQTVLSIGPGSLAFSQVLA